MPVQNLKCACDDGEYVHPWECCSTGACNIFCCNCGGPCRSNTTTTTTTTQADLYTEVGDEQIMYRKKRDMSEIISGMYDDMVAQHDMEAVNVSKLNRYIIGLINLK